MHEEGPIIKGDIWLNDSAMLKIFYMTFMQMIPTSRTTVEWMLQCVLFIGADNFATAVNEFICPLHPHIKSSNTVVHVNKLICSYFASLHFARG